MEGKYKSLKITRKSRFFHLFLDRPTSSNALSREFFAELPEALRELDRNSEVAVIILSGLGDHFCSGIDRISISEETRGSDSGRTAEKLRREIKFMQQAITAIEECRKPVIAAIHGACIGGGIDIITACDLRYATENAFFSVKQVELGLAADLGTLQRLPPIVGLGNAMELALTARKFTASEAKEMGLVSMVFSDEETLMRKAEGIAECICGLSLYPTPVIGRKSSRIQIKSVKVDRNPAVDQLKPREELIRKHPSYMKRFY